MPESYGRYISVIYADRFDSYAGQKLEGLASRPRQRVSWSRARSPKPMAS